MYYQDVVVPPEQLQAALEIFGMQQLVYRDLSSPKMGDASNLRGWQINRHQAPLLVPRNSLFGQLGEMLARLGLT